MRNVSVVVVIFALARVCFRMEFAFQSGLRGGLPGTPTLICFIEFCWFLRVCGGGDCNANSIRKQTRARAKITTTTKTFRILILTKNALHVYTTETNKLLLNHNSNMQLLHYRSWTIQCHMENHILFDRQWFNLNLLTVSILYLSDEWLSPIDP